MQNILVENRNCGKINQNVDKKSNFWLENRSFS